MLTYHRGSSDPCTLAVVCEFIGENSLSAAKAFADVAALDEETSRQAVERFRSNLSQDRRWLVLLSQIDTVDVLENPEAMMTLLIDGFGLEDIDAMDIVLRLAARAKEHELSDLQN